jgi:hypothetical protein
MLGSWLGLAVRFSKLPGLVESLETGETGPLEKLAKGFLKNSKAMLNQSLKQQFLQKFLKKQQD